jgi:hypothetical protein
VDGYTTQAAWDNEFTYMQNLGMTLWIYQWTGDSKGNTTIYPTNIAGYTQSSTYDQVETALATAESFGDKVWMGLVFNAGWWRKQGTDLGWLLGEAAEMNAVADELYANYYSRYPDTFAGWYINWEMDNYAFYNTVPEQKQNMITALNAVSQHLDTLNPNLPSSIAPYFNSNGGATPEQWEVFWYDIMSQTSVDVLAMQDGVGVGHATIDMLPHWYQHVCAGVWQAGKLCWTDLENFVGSNHLAPGPTQRIIDQHQAEYQWVDHIITYSFIEAMSPQFNPSWITQYNAYKAYVDSVRNGTPAPPTNTPTSTPVPPTNTPTKTPTITPTPGGPTNTPVPPTNTPVPGSSLLLGKAYTASTPASPTYPDTGGVELTDGVTDAATYSNAAWQGRLLSGGYSFTADLGAAQTIQQFKAYFLKDTKPSGIKAPTSVAFSYSSDGTNWTNACSVSEQGVGQDDVRLTYACSFSPVTRRYVRMIVTAVNWSFVDEWEAY